MRITHMGFKCGMASATYAHVVHTYKEVDRKTETDRHILTAAMALSVERILCGASYRTTAHLHAHTLSIAFSLRTISNHVTHPYTI